MHERGKRYAREDLVLIETVEVPLERRDKRRGRWVFRGSGKQVLGRGAAIGALELVGHPNAPVSKGKNGVKCGQGHHNWWDATYEGRPKVGEGSRVTGKDAPTWVVGETVP